MPATIVNIGGVANVTWYDGGENLIGFDTGPGNALLDDYMRHFLGKITTLGRIRIERNPRIIG